MHNQIDQSLCKGMIREMSSSAQYICTTFRPELIETTTKFFGVTYRNKVWSLFLTTKQP